MAETLGQLLPVYVLVDESGSMNPYVGDLNAGMASLHQSLLGEPMAAAKVRFSVLGFSNVVTERLILADLRAENELPPLTANGGTSYKAAFDALLRRIPQDVQTLKSQGYRVHRPAVFFLSDGQPNYGEDWEATHRQLVDRATTKAAPNIIACGIGEAQERTILSVATQPQFAFISLPGAQLGPAIAKFFTALTKSVVESGNAMASGSAELVVERPEGFRILIDEV